MTKTILALAFEAGIRPFDPIPATVAKARNTGELASLLLAGRNPYFDKEYRDRFGTKVHSLEIMHSRLVLGALESAQPPEGPRRYRAVLFRCDGEVLYQTPADRLMDEHAAAVDLRYQAQHISESKILEALLTRQLKVASRMKENAERALAALHQAHGP
jgi:hypothetical protein